MCVTSTVWNYISAHAEIKDPHLGGIGQIVQEFDSFVNRYWGVRTGNMQKQTLLVIRQMTPSMLQKESLVKAIGFPHNEMENELTVVVLHCQYNRAATHYGDLRSTKMGVALKWLCHLSPSLN